MGFVSEKKVLQILKTASVYGFVIWVSAWKAKNARLPEKEMHIHRQSQWLDFQEEAEGVMEEILPHVVSNTRPFSHLLLLLLGKTRSYHHCTQQFDKYSFFLASNTLPGCRHRIHCSYCLFATFVSITISSNAEHKYKIVATLRAASVCRAPGKLCKLVSSQDSGLQAEHWSCTIARMQGIFLSFYISVWCYRALLATKILFQLVSFCRGYPAWKLYCKLCPTWVALSTPMCVQRVCS